MSMKDKLMKLKSVATPIDKNESEGLKAALMKLLSDSDSKLKDKIGGMSKVSVIAKDSHGLKEGLDKAKELMESKEMPDMEDSEDESEEMEDESPEHEMMETAEEEASEHPETAEEIDAKIQELMDKKKKLQLLKV